MTQKFPKLSPPSLSSWAASQRPLVLWRPSPEVRQNPIKANVIATKHESNTSLISLILAPPLPIRDPHWLAGTISRRVTWGLFPIVAPGPLLFWTSFCHKREKIGLNYIFVSISCHSITSSNFRAISEKALSIASVEPVTVTILSGHEPSEMFILAPLWSSYKSVIHSIVKHHFIPKFIQYRPLRETF